MKGYHDKLVELQDTLLSLKIVEEIKQEDDRNEKIGQILPYLLTKQNQPPENKPEKK